MTTTRPQHYQRQMLLALVLFLIGQVAFALHSHDLSLHSVDAEECAICLVTTSDNPGPVSGTPQRYFPAGNNQYLPALELLVSRSLLTTLQPRAPPLS